MGATKHTIERWAVFTLLALCAYGIGMLIGGRIERSFHRQTTSGLSQVNRPLVSSSPSVEPEEERTNSQLSAFLRPNQSAWEAFAAKVHELERNEGWELANLQLAPLLRTLATNDYPRAWSLLNALPASGWLGHFQQGALQSCLIRTWAKQDRKVAMAVVESMPAGQSRIACLGDVLRVWAGNEPAAALEYARKLPTGESQNSALSSVILGTAEHDPHTAVQFIASLPAFRNIESSMEFVSQKLALTDPQAALRLFEQIPASPIHRFSLGVIAGAMAARDISETIAWAYTLKELTDQAAALDPVMSMLLKTNVAEAERLVTSAANRDLQKQLAATLVSAWFQTDVRGAADWAAQLPEGPVRSEALRQINIRWSMSDPEAAAQFALTCLNPGQERTTALRDIARNWCLTLDEDGSVQYAGQISTKYAQQIPNSTERDAFVSGLCEALVTQNPEESARQASSLSNTKIQIEAIRSAVDMWVAQDQDSAAKWCSGLPNGPARNEAVPIVSRFWSSIDPVSCAAWLQSLPADKARAQAAEAFVAQSTDKHPELASQWVEAISDETKRSMAISRVASAWLRTAPDAARNWVLQTSLPADQKSRLLGE